MDIMWIEEENKMEYCCIDCNIVQSKCWETNWWNIHSQRIGYTNEFHILHTIFNSGTSPVCSAHDTGRNLRYYIPVCGMFHVIYSSIPHFSLTHKYPSCFPTIKV